MLEQIWLLILTVIDLMGVFKMMLLIALSMILAGLGRRIAGGSLNQWFSKSGERVTGDTPVRLFFGATIAASAFMAGAVWWHALFLIPAVWVGTMISNFESLAMGHGQRSYVHDFIGLSAHGVLGAIAPTLLLWYLDYPAFYLAALGGVLISPLYTLGWWMIPSVAGNPKYPPGFRGGQELGEFFYGAVSAFGVFAAVVLS